MFEGWPEVAPLQTSRSDTIRSRLIERARADDTRARVPAARRFLTGGAGWLVAAGLATLLLTHHTFHEPLDFGWVAASVLAVLALYLGYQVYTLRKRLSDR